MQGRKNLDSVTRPVVVSQLSAQKQADAWERVNAFHTIIDKDGLEWSLSLEQRQFVEAGKNSLTTEVVFCFQTQARTEDFIRTKTLDLEQDERLISLLGDASVPMRLTPKPIRVEATKDIKQEISEALLLYKARLFDGSLQETKRKLIGLWIDQHRQFDFK